MKCIAVGDAFITPSMMKTAIEKFANLVDSAEYFFFGMNNRKAMRDTVKAIERGDRDKLELPEGFMDAVKEAEIIMVHLCPVTKSVIEAAPKLKYILCNRGGVENIDVKSARERGVTVLNNPAHNANACAEFVIGQILCETRNIARSCMALKSGRWREKFPNSEEIVELKDMTIGVVGFGNIGELVCEKLSCLGCKVLISTPSRHNRENPRINWEKTDFVPFDTLLERSDVVTCHVRGSVDNVLFGKREFDLMKPSAYFINTSRSCYVDMNALYEALCGDEIRGAAIDVFDAEPLGPSYPFLELDNVTLTNHRAGDTINAYADSPEMMFTALASWLSNGKEPKFIVR